MGGILSSPWIFVIVYKFRKEKAFQIDISSKSHIRVQSTTAFHYVSQLYPFIGPYCVLDGAAICGGLEVEILLQYAYRHCHCTFPLPAAHRTGQSNFAGDNSNNNNIMVPSFWQVFAYTSRSIPYGDAVQDDFPRKSRREKCRDDSYLSILYYIRNSLTQKGKTE